MGVLVSDENSSHIQDVEEVRFVFHHGKAVTLHALDQQLEEREVELLGHDVGCHTRVLLQEVLDDLVVVDHLAGVAGRVVGQVGQEEGEEAKKERFCRESHGGETLQTIDTLDGHGQ